MSKGIEEFKNELASNSALATEISDLLKKNCNEGKTPEELAETAVSLLKDKGYQITEKEFLAFLNKEAACNLSDKDLSNVTGGYIPYCGQGN